MKDKRKGKLDKHFPIFINGRQVKVLSYHIKPRDGREILTLRTMIRSPWFKGIMSRPCYISIGADEALQDLRCWCYGILSNTPSLLTYYFYILKEGDTVSYGEVVSSEPDCQT